MKHGGKIAVGLAGALVFPASLCAVTPDSPYQPIVERNVFGLKPPPLPPEVKPIDVPAPLIELQGIVSILGKDQVLFRTLMPSSKLGEAPKSTSLVMSVGERVADVEVLEINVAAGTVKFKNHGQEQIKDIVKDSVKQTPSSAPGVPGIPLPTFPTPAAANLNSAPAGASTITTFGNRVSGTVPTRTLRVNNPGAGNPGGISGQTQSHVMTAEEQAVLIEINRKLTEKDVADGKMPPLPPTGLQ